MAAASLTRLQKRIIQLLNARPSDNNYSATPSGKNTSYQISQEIIDAILEADARVVIEGYLSVKNHAQKSRFEVVTANLVNNSPLPEFVGMIGRVDVSEDSGSTWNAGIESTYDDVLMGRSLAAGSLPFISGTAFQGFYAIENNTIYHTSGHARLYLPQFTKGSSACQAHEGHEPAIIAGAMAQLKKDSSNADHEYYSAKFNEMLPIIRLGAKEVTLK